MDFLTILELTRLLLDDRSGLKIDCYYPPSERLRTLHS